MTNTKTTTRRYAVCIGTMVIGEGATVHEAEEDAAATIESQGIDSDDALMTSYDSSTHEVRYSGGIVQICTKEAR